MEVIATNRNAKYEFAFLEQFTAGIQLRGTEIKSIRIKDVSIAEGYCVFKNNELFVLNTHIAIYEQATYNNHEPRRERKLLLSKQELKKLSGKLKDKGLTIIPTRLFISDNGYAKLNIALAKGKKIHDKRNTIKDRDVKREIDRGLRDH
ncbi:MAG: SsrA-binding protein SmpB [Flavobacteriales bacterium]|nr:SsrA-binding protein SmpB [Flavobacteriales bacterium]